MKNNPSNESGFSVVELLITLFIAVAFIATGYQLYSAIVKDGGDARFRARASNLAYENLRRAAADTTIPCPSGSAVSTPASPANTGLDNPIITQTISAPQGCSGGLWTNKIMKVEMRVQYGPSTNRQEVTHAIYTAPQ